MIINKKKGTQLIYISVALQIIFFSCAINNNVSSNDGNNISLKKNHPLKKKMTFIQKKLYVLKIIYMTKT